MTCSTKNRPNARLRAAVKAAYQTFAHYSPGPQLATCHCELCLEPDVETRLLTIPPRHIPFRLLCEYTWALSGSDQAIFNADEYRHFLPRYFHFIAYGLWPNPSGDREPTLRGLGVHSFREHWQSTEVEIIDEYFDALIEQQLARQLMWGSQTDGSEYPCSDVTDLLSTLAIAGASMDRLTSEWERQFDGLGLQHVACVVEYCESRREPGMPYNEISGPWWNECQNQARILKSWLYRREHAHLLQSASDAEAHLPTKDLLCRSAKAIEG